MNSTLPGNVYVWRADLDTLAIQALLLNSVLSQDQQQRANRFRLKRDSNRFIARRGRANSDARGCIYFKANSSICPLTFAEKAQAFLC